MFLRLLSSRVRRCARVRRLGPLRPHHLVQRRHPVVSSGRSSRRIAGRTGRLAGEQARRLTDVRSPVPPDVEISQSVPLTPVRQLFHELFGLREDELYAYGTYKGKLSLSVYDRLRARKDGHYVVVVGMTPTALGEGKSTTTVGLSQALGAHLNQSVLTCIRQPSMGPTFGVKGGAAGCM